MTLPAVTGPVKLETFHAETIDDIENIRKLVTHKLMESRLDLNFNTIITNFLTDACQGLPSQEINKLIKATNAIIAEKRKPNETVPNAQPKNNKKNKRPTLAYERDKIITAYDDYYNYDEE